MLKTPEFWTKKNLISYALLPLSFFYFLGFSLVKFFSNPQKISKPVICIGNLIAGGSGKTPVAIAIGKILQEENVDFAFLSRGYMNGGVEFLMLRKADENKAEEVGDEPLLLLDTAPTFIAKNRFFGAQQIEQMEEFKLVILDDGMQNNSLKRDYTILVVDGKIGFGNGFMIPAGPMREPLHEGLQKANLVVVIGDPTADLLQKLAGKKITKGKIIPKNSAKFSGKKIIAFCGLAFPEKFFSLLRSEGLEVIETHSFADHYDYGIAELENLYQIAKEKNATLVATKKDWVKFPKLFQDKISYFDIELELENKALIKEELKRFYE